MLGINSTKACFLFNTVRLLAAPVLYEIASFSEDVKGDIILNLLFSFSIIGVVLRRWLHVYLLSFTLIPGWLYKLVSIYSIDSSIPFRVSEEHLTRPFYSP